MDIDSSEDTRLLCRLKSEHGDIIGDMLDLPTDCTVEQLSMICNALLKNEENTPYRFFINENEILKSLINSLNPEKVNTEDVIEIIYEEQSVFKVRPVTRCTGSMPGHAEAVISVSFSPDGRHLASGSGDTTVRFWDLTTQTPLHTSKGHVNWVLCIAWSPDSLKLASACKKGEIIIWDPEMGQQIGKTMSGHKQWITSLSWEPYHKNSECRYLASSSKDNDIRIWDTILGTTVRVLSGHMQSVTAIRWGGSDLLYSASQDRTVKVWRANDGILCRTLQGHGHWVNTLALNTDYLNRIGPYDPVKDPHKKIVNPEELKKFALRRYDDMIKASGERLVSGSDDFTLFLWDAEKDKKPLRRLTGHQQLVNDVRFSPDGRILASASFDKSIRLWDAKSGSFMYTLRGHVKAVYMVSFSVDSRLLVSGSADSTLKLWNIKEKKLEIDLPGHADEIFAIDWSTDGSKVVTGGKDKVLRIWQN